MSISHPVVFRGARRFGLCLLVSLSILVWSSAASAQRGGNTFGSRAVGGVMVDPTGMLTNADVAARGQLTRQIAEALEAVPEGLDQAVQTRKISLRRLDKAIAKAVADGTPLPDAVYYLGGLLQIQYVAVLPDDNDIILVGPGEGWTADARGVVVGVTSGRAVMLLDDLLVALRSAAAPRRSVISCSIDPTPDGLQRLRAHAARLRTIGNPRSTAAGIEQQLGPQKISVTGVPDTSHFARVMVAADYRMKRVSMNLEPSPVAGLPSFMAMMKAGGSYGMNNMLPRWWLAPDYEPLLRDEEGLTWQLRKASVKAMAENDFLDAAGVKHNTGRADVVSQRWAQSMTDHYDELAKADPVFGQLRNCMDLAIVSALIVQERLTEKAGLSLPLLMGTGGLEPIELNAPKQVPSKASLVHKGRNWMIACGGVEINAWELVSQSEPSQSLSAIRSKIVFRDDNQWWSN